MDYDGYNISNKTTNGKTAMLTFTIHNCSLVSDVVSLLKKSNLEKVQYLNHSLFVMNNFSTEGMHISVAPRGSHGAICLPKVIMTLSA